MPFEKGDNAALRALLLVKTDVNAAQVDGTTALHWAVYRNEAAVVDQLLKAGAKVGAKEPRRHHSSVHGGHLWRSDHRRLPC